MLRRGFRNLLSARLPEARSAVWACAVGCLRGKIGAIRSDKTGSELLGVKCL